MRIHRITGRFDNLGLDPVGTWIFRIYREIKNTYEYNINMVPDLSFLIANANDDLNPVRSIDSYHLARLFIESDRRIKNKSIITYMWGLVW